MSGVFSFLHRIYRIVQSRPVGKGTVIEAGAHIGDGVEIGRDCRIRSGAVLCHCTVGDRTVIGSNTVIGQDGFGWIPPSQAGTSLPLKKPQTLRVVIGSDVDIGALCTIARGSWRDTHVHDGVKMDDQVHLGHNVHIGENTIIAAQSGVAGSTHIGKNCLIGGQVGVAQHLHIGDGVVVAARSAVTRSLPAGGMYGGSPATDIANWRREVATVRRLARQGRGEANTSSTLPSSAA